MRGRRDMEKTDIREGVATWQKGVVAMTSSLKIRPFHSSIATKLRTTKWSKIGEGESAI